MSPTHPQADAHHHTHVPPVYVHATGQGPLLTCMSSDSGVAVSSGDQGPHLPPSASWLASLPPW
jgi:hypothetical protein